MGKKIWRVLNFVIILLAKNYVVELIQRVKKWSYEWQQVNNKARLWWAGFYWKQEA